MKRQALYSSAKKTPGTTQAAAGPAHAPAPGLSSGLNGLRALGARHAGMPRFLGGAAFIALLATAGYAWLKPAPPALNPAEIETAVLRSLQKKPLPSRAVKAAEMVRPAVVQVRGFNDITDATARGKKSRSGRFAPGAPDDKSGKNRNAPDGMRETSLGTGVVVIDDGTILTNLHVVFGAKRVRITFHDGSESEASLVSAHPENDLAVIKAHKIPDDLPAATLGSSSRLKPGDEIVAIGFPFGMGPSISYGVISGLDREFHSAEGKRVLTRLIQFDAAANPGNSGGPLVTMQGDVVGIVTAIFNPTESRTFIGIGFAVTIAVAAGNAGVGDPGGIHPF
ncbi:MAG: trypsin-like peptidase domain-containing protein [Burkholderiales bacterium]|nr:trypsin-like peptidase domain-containing protein [Burkholderiales bacterium]